MSEVFKQEIKEFLDSEIWDYSLIYEIEDNWWDDEMGYYNITIKDRYWEKLIWNGTVSFSITRDDEDNFELSVELWEDSWEKVETFDRTIKYFWMALLWK